MAKSLATTENKELVSAPEADDSIFDTGGSTGFENVTASDLLIPRLTILQSNSPQVTRGQPEYNPDLKPGEIYDVGLGESFGESLLVIPVHYFKQWLEWAPRNSGKGLQEVHLTDAIMAKTEKNEKNKDVLPNGNYIAETAQFYVLNMNARGRKSFIAMTSTQLKKARAWLTKAQDIRITRGDGTEFQAPLFYRSYILTTVPESNAEGNWIGWKIDMGPKLTELDNWKSAKQIIDEFRKSIDEGTVRGDVSSMEAESGGGGGGRGGSRAQADTGQEM